jgi:hypothetical protein
LGGGQRKRVIEQKILQFRPDVVLYVANNQELEWVFEPLEHLVNNRLLDQFPFIRNALDRTGIRAEAGKPLPQKIVRENKLAPFAEDTLRAVLERFRDQTTPRGIRPALVLLEIPDDDPSRAEIFDRLLKLGLSVRLPVLDLQGSFAGVRDRKALWIAPWDSHTNAEGHRLLAERLYTLLLKEGLVPKQAP